MGTIAGFTATPLARKALRKVLLLSLRRCTALVTQRWCGSVRVVRDACVLITAIMSLVAVAVYVC